MDTGRLLGLAEETGLTLNELIDLWTGETGKQLAAAAKAITAGEAAEARRVVHGAFGGTALYGLSDLAQELRGIEALLAAGDLGAAGPALSHARTEFARVCQALERVRQ
jgi:HPt (histidine-containing phosphotransfer) domain-containing protein